MKWDICAGNPPFGADKKGSSRFLHYMIFKTALTFCKDKLTFIMPSKPIVQQLDDKWLNIFKTAVCTNIEVVKKGTFKNTNMDATAIYYCDRKASPDDYDKQLDVDKKIYNMFDDEGHKSFINIFEKMKPLQIFRACKMYGKTLTPTEFENEVKKVYNKMSDDKYYLFVNRARNKPEQKGDTQLISGNLTDIGVLQRDDAVQFIRDHKGEKNIIECPNKKYGENLKNLMINGYVLRYALWLTQTNQHIYQIHYRYIPNIDYTNVDTDEKLLSECGFTLDEIEKVMNYLKDFDFTQNRNDMVREYDG